MPLSTWALYGLSTHQQNSRRPMGPRTVAETQSIPGQAIDVWGLDLPAEASQVAVPKVVGDDEQKIGSFVGHVEGVQGGDEK